MHPQSTLSQQRSQAAKAFWQTPEGLALRSAKWPRWQPSEPIPSVLVEKFWARVDRSDADGCWIWTGWRSNAGYGMFNIGHRKVIPAHRFSYILHYGALPEGYFACHHCDNRPCVRPDHIFGGTPLDNMRDASRKGRTAPQRYPGRTGQGETHYSARHPEKVRCGEQCTWARLRASDVIAIRVWHAQGGISYREIADAYGVSAAAIRRAVLGQSWQSVPR